LVGRYEGKRPLGRLTRRWKYIIKMDLQAIALEGADWIYLGEYGDRCRAVVNALMNLRFP
jgi:hypothetical protein